MDTCSILDCGRPILARQLCNRHYLRLQRNGDPLINKNPRYRPELSVCDRFWSCVNFDGPLPSYAPDPGQCWIWEASIATHTGYGQFRLDRRPELAHRIAYMELIGPIPDGLVSDHLCRVRACCNPWHIEIVTDSVNLLRGIGPQAVNARKTVCPKCQQLYDKIDNRGKRICTTCTKRYETEYNAKRAARKQPS